MNQLSWIISKPSVITGTLKVKEGVKKVNQSDALWTQPIVAAFEDEKEGHSQSLWAAPKARKAKAAASQLGPPKRNTGFPTPWF